LNDSSSYLGIDMSPETIKDCELKYFCPSRKFQINNAQSLKLPNASFDVTTSFEVLEHVERPEDIVSKPAKVLTQQRIFAPSTLDFYNHDSGLLAPIPFHINEMKAAVA
jgi:2-polyprenyl-3-methyl-5-hydroxy-6-metoxy-1,4-benzoquinol methylase